ncbi:MAG: class I SAM-dependent methyltransferase [Bacteroidales bacterium]|nr:class I SAM-dependent methyltransferase [Bacteroidales bacterium]
METLKINNHVENNIADTLYITLFMRARESKRKNNTFNDPTACYLVSRLDYDFTKYSNAPKSSIGCIIRANYFDKITVDFIKKNKNPIIINLGCGLDSRFQRVNKFVNGKAIFYEIDLPEVIALRKQLIPESKNDIYISGSIFETDWMDNLKSKHPEGQFLFAIEGVIMYFEKTKIKQAFINIAERFSNSEIACDIISSWLVKNSHRHDTIKNAKAQFVMSCDNESEFEKWHPNISVINSKRYADFKEMKRIGFLKFTIMKAIPAFRNSSKLVRLSINSNIKNHFYGTSSFTS